MHRGGKPASITSRGCGSQPHCQSIDMMENSFSSARFSCLKNQSSPFQSPNLSLVLALLSEEGLTFPPVQEEMGWERLSKWACLSQGWELPPHTFFLNFFFIIYLFIYFWLCWVFVSVRGLSLVVASGGHSSSRCVGLSLSRPLLLQSTGSRRTGSVIVAHRPSCSAACGILPDQGSNLCPLHWQADSQPLRHQGSPAPYFLMQGPGALGWAARVEREHKEGDQEIGRRSHRVGEGEIETDTYRDIQRWRVRKR